MYGMCEWKSDFVPIQPARKRGSKGLPNTRTHLPLPPWPLQCSGGFSNYLSISSWHGSRRRRSRWWSTSPGIVVSSRVCVCRPAATVKTTPASCASAFNRGNANAKVSCRKPPSHTNTHPSSMHRRQLLPGVVAKSRTVHGPKQARASY